MGTAAKKNVTVSLGNPMVVLTLVFVVLKLNGNIDWSWPWVLAPMWLPLACIVGFFAACLIFAGVLFLVAAVCEAIR